MRRSAAADMIALVTNLLLLIAAAAPPAASALEAGSGGGPLLATHVPGLVRCGGELVAFAEPPAPFAQPWYGGTAAAARPVGFTFRIDASGRPLGIVHEAGAGLTPAAPDLAPALAAATFVPGRAHASCRMAFTTKVETAAAASLADVARFTVFPSGPPQRAFFDRLRPEGSTCFGEPPVPRLHAYPDFARIPQRSGTVAHTMVRFDIDRDGRPTRVAVADSGGNAVLDRASVAAVRRSRFAAEARTGCLIPYHRRADLPLSPPDMPADPRFEDRAPCEAGGWTRGPALVFPEAWRRRGIEGWAVVRYDLAPWGEPGNVTVLAAEPAAEFGEAAADMIRQTRKRASTAARIGCIAKVRYRMGRRGEAMESDAPPF